MTDYPALFAATQQASYALGALAPTTTDALLRELAAAVRTETPFLLAENARDLARMPGADPRHDRLRLSAERLAGIAEYGSDRALEWLGQQHQRALVHYDYLFLTAD